MTHASSEVRSYASKPTPTLQPTIPATQAATRSAYIDSILDSWPAPTLDQQRTVGSLLASAAPLITVAEYQSLEIQRWILENETPGKFGYFTAEDAA